MNVWLWIIAGVTAVLVAIVVTVVARRMLGAPVGWARGIAVGLLFYLILTPSMNHVVVSAGLAEAEARDISANPAVVVAVVVLVMAWAFLLGAAVLLVAEVLVPTGTVRDPVTWVRDAVATRRRTRRYAEVAAIVVKHGLRRMLQGDPRRADGTELGRVLAQTLEDAGVTFVKFGQVLSTRPDLLPPRLVAQLATLQSQASPEPWERIATVLDAELPQWRENLEVEHEPLAAASIAQVHRATLRTGEVTSDGTPVVRRVVVKVQRPEAREQVVVDVDILERLAESLTRRARWAREMDVNELARGFSTALVDELDYRREAENMRLVGQACRGTGVALPVLYEAESTSRVLVMSEVDGVTLDRAGTLLETFEPQQRTDLAQTLMTCVLHQILITGVFHADLHPGNVILTDDGRLVLLDLGSVGVLDRELRELLLGLLAAFDAEDNETATALLLRLLPPGDYDSYALRRDLGAAMTVIAAGAGADATGVALLFDVFRDHRLSLPPHVAAALRTVGSLQGCLAILDPDGDVAGLIRRGTRRVSRDLVNLNEVRGLTVSRGLGVAALVSSVPATLDEGVRSLARGRSISTVIGGLSDIARRALAELVPTIVACVLVLAAVGLFSVSGGPMLTSTLSWATYLSGLVGAAGAALMLRVLFQQAARA